MSFSAQIKQELCRTESKSCCRRAELAGIVAFSGSMVHDSDGECLRLRTENATVARRLFSLARQQFRGQLPIRQNLNVSLYTIAIRKSPMLDVLLQQLGLWRDGRVKFALDPFIVQDDCCIRAFLRGAFLGGGSVSDPEKSYHFELVTHYKTLSDDLCQLLADCEFPLKTIFRKSTYVTYAKDSEVIGDLLAFMGASSSVMELYNIKIMKDMRNNVNRRVNCETANVAKTVDAAVRQVHSIRRLERLRGLDSLPENLQETARLRLEYPEASLAELGEMLSPPIGKSGVNHRLKKIMQIADSI